MTQRFNTLLPGLLAVLFYGSVLADDLTTEIPFQQVQHLIVVKVSVGGIQDLNFAIDTAATTTTVTPKIAKRLRLKKEKIYANAFGRKVKVHKVLLPEISLGSWRIESVPALVGKVSLTPGSPIDGLIGIDLLKRTSLTIDFESGSITLGHARTFNQSVPFLTQIPYVIFRAKTSTGLMWLQLDSGSPLTLLYKDRVRGRVPLVDTHRTKLLDTLGGRLTLNEVEVPELGIGGSQWQDCTAFLRDGHTENMKTLDGVVGMSSLGFERVSFDFERNLLSWER